MVEQHSKYKIKAGVFVGFSLVTKPQDSAKILTRAFIFKFFFAKVKTDSNFHKTNKLAHNNLALLAS